MTFYRKKTLSSKNREGQALFKSDSDNIEFTSKKHRSSNIGSTDRNQKCAVAFEQKSTHFGHKSTHNDKILYDAGPHRHQQHRHRLRFRDISAVVTKKLLEINQGITYLDIIKLADDPGYTPKQAQDTLRNLKSDGKLHTQYRTKPQQYYLSQEDAEYAALQHKRSTHIHPFRGRGDI